MNLQDFLFVAPKKAKASVALDSADAGVAPMGDYFTRDIKLATAASVLQWLEDDHRDEGETLIDRLIALFVGIADANKDGEITDDEAAVLDEVLECAFDYLVAHGITEDDASALLNDQDETAAERIRSYLIENGPADIDDDLNEFAFGDLELDAAYKKVVAVRGGKKVRINKRISGTVRLSARQKVALRKARMKSHSAAAMIKRAKSLRVRKQMGI